MAIDNLSAEKPVTADDRHAHEAVMGSKSKVGGYVDRQESKHCVRLSEQFLTASGEPLDRSYLRSEPTHKNVLIATFFDMDPRMHSYTRLRNLAGGIFESCDMFLGIQ